MKVIPNTLHSMKYESTQSGFGLVGFITRTIQRPDSFIRMLSFGYYVLGYRH
jgi:hypothetical protein